MNIQEATTTLTNMRALMQLLKADVTLLKNAVGGGSRYYNGKTLWDSQRNEIVRFTKVFAETEDEQTKALLEEAKEFLAENKVWFPHYFTKTEQEFKQMLDAYEHVVRYPTDSKPAKNMKTCGMLTDDDRVSLKTWVKERRIAMREMLVLFTKIQKAAKNSVAANDEESDLAIALLKVVQGHYDTQFVKRIKIVNIDRGIERVREGMTAYCFNDPYAKFTLAVNLAGETRARTFVYHDQSMRGGGWMVNQDYKKGQVYEF